MPTRKAPLMECQRGLVFLGYGETRHAGPYIVACSSTARDHASARGADMGNAKGRARRNPPDAPLRLTMQSLVYTPLTR
jgi:hypothetical protein